MLAAAAAVGVPLPHMPLSIPRQAPALSRWFRTEPESFARACSAAVAAERLIAIEPTRLVTPHLIENLLSALVGGSLALFGGRVTDRRRDRRLRASKLRAAGKRFLTAAVQFAGAWTSGRGQRPDATEYQAAMWALRLVLTQESEQERRSRRLVRTALDKLTQMEAAAYGTTGWGAGEVAESRGKRLVQEAEGVCQAAVTAAAAIGTGRSAARRQGHHA